MEKEITIENLQQENAELKVKIEANEAEIARLKDDFKNENDLHKLYDNLYCEYVKKYNEAIAFIKTIAMMLDAAADEETTSASSARLELISNTIAKFTKQ